MGDDNWISKAIASEAGESPGIANDVMAALNDEAGWEWGDAAKEALADEAGDAAIAANVMRAVEPAGQVVDLSEVRDRSSQRLGALVAMVSIAAVAFLWARSVPIDAVDVALDAGPATFASLSDVVIEDLSAAADVDVLVMEGSEGAVIIWWEEAT